MEIDYQTFESALKNWCELRYNEFKYYWPLNGGWEGWVQVDFAAYLQHNPPQVTLYREKKIYTDPKKRVDWLVNGDAPNPRKRIAVEIKCLSGGILNVKSPGTELKKFIAGIQKDQRKLKQKNISMDNRECQTVVIAINFAPEVQSSLKAAGLNCVTTAGDGEVELWAQYIYTQMEVEPSFEASTSLGPFATNPLSTSSSMFTT